MVELLEAHAIRSARIRTRFQVFPTRLHGKRDDGRWFDTIAQFLEYMSGWFERLPAGWEDERKYVPGLSDSEEDMDDDSEEEKSD